MILETMEERNTYQAGTRVLQADQSAVYSYLALDCGGPELKADKSVQPIIFEWILPT